MLNKTRLLLLLLFSLSCSAAQTVIEVIPLLNRPATELQPLITPFLESTDHLVGNNFSLIVKTTPARLGEIKVLIKKLDTALSNLNIQVIQSKDRTADQLNANANLAIAIPVNNPAETQLQISGQYQQSQQNLTSQSQQTLRTLEGKPAYIKIGGNYPIHFTTVYNSSYGQYPVSTNTQLLEVTTGFSVLPRLNGEQVSLEISPWADQLQNSGQIETQSAQTTLKTKLGQWVEIGTINQQYQSTGSGILNTEQASGQTLVHILVRVEKAD